jgi:hypothetical protein
MFFSTGGDGGVAFFGDIVCGGGTLMETSTAGSSAEVSTLTGRSSPVPATLAACSSVEAAAVEGGVEFYIAFVGGAADVGSDVNAGFVGSVDGGDGSAFGGEVDNFRSVVRRVSVGRGGGIRRRRRRCVRRRRI